MPFNLSGEPRERHSTVCAVIVTYFPDPKTLREVLHSIALQVDAVVIVDNTPHRAIDLTALAGAKVQRTKLFCWVKIRNCHRAERRYCLGAVSSAKYVCAGSGRVLDQHGEAADRSCEYAACGGFPGGHWTSLCRSTNCHSSSALQVGTISMRQVECSKNPRRDNFLRHANFVRIPDHAGGSEKNWRFRHIIVYRPCGQ